MTDIVLLILLFILQTLFIITIIDIILIGFPVIKFDSKLNKRNFLITQKNLFETQGKVECSAFASAYVYRHFGIEAKGFELYEEMPCKSSKGYVYCKGIVLLAKKYGFHAKFYTGNLNALKNTVAKGIPVIVMIHSKLHSHFLHYITIVGYDEENIYAVDSVVNLRNANNEHYNRVISIAEFKKLWNVSLLKQPLYFNLFFEIKNDASCS